MWTIAAIDIGNIKEKEGDYGNFEFKSYESHKKMDGTAT